MPGGSPGSSAHLPSPGWDHGQGKGRTPFGGSKAAQGVGDPGPGPLPAPGQPQGTENLRRLEPSLPQDTWSAIAPEGPGGSERQQERAGSGAGIRGPAGPVPSRFAAIPARDFGQRLARG